MVTKIWRTCCPDFDSQQTIHRHNFYLCQVSEKLIFFFLVYVKKLFVIKRLPYFYLSYKFEIHGFLKKIKETANI